MGNCIINRATHTKNFTIYSNELINNTDLSPGSLILLMSSLSKPPGWKTSILRLSKIYKVSKGTIQKWVNELKEAGYLVIHKKPSGHTMWEWSENKQTVEKSSKKLAPSPLKSPYPKNEDEESSPDLSTKTGDNPQITPIKRPPDEKMGEPHQPDPKKPDPKKPDPKIWDALVSTDPLEINKRSSKIPPTPQRGAVVDIKPDFETCFKKIWDAWPNTFNQKRAKRAFKRFYSQNLDNPLAATNYLIDDARWRVKSQQLGFINMNLSNYILDSRFLDGKSIRGYQ